MKAKRDAALKEAHAELEEVNAKIRVGEAEEKERARKRKEERIREEKTLKEKKKLHKIWIADDDDAIRLILEESLGSEGFMTKIFSNGEDLIKELETEKPDLIITDVQMPGMLGNRRSTSKDWM